MDQWNVTMRIACVRMEVKCDIGTNRQSILDAIEQAAEAGAGVLLTPEGSLSGYTHEFDPDVVAKALDEVTAMAKAKGVGLALGTCFVEADGRCFNQIRFYHADGTYLGFHSKILRCGSLADPSVGEINHFAASELRTFDYGGIRIGGLICNDLWANPGCTPMPDPHLSQQLSNMGARIVFHAVNGGRDGGEWSQVAWNYHESNLRMRARAGKVWIVTVDNCAPTTLPCSSPSGVIDPEGNWVCRTEPQGPGFFVHTIESQNDGDS